MKPWELALICAPHLKAVLSAVERTQLDFYGIDRNFLQIEEALTTFLRGSNKSKKNMEVYTNAMVEKQLMTNQTEISVSV